jgi:hypothetical protein
MDKATYDEVIQVTATTAMKTMLEKIAAVRCKSWSRKYKKFVPNVAAAGREAFAEYITRHREEVE